MFWKHCTHCSFHILWKHCTSGKLFWCYKILNHFWIVIHCDYFHLKNCFDETPNVTLSCASLFISKAIHIHLNVLIVLALLSACAIFIVYYFIIIFIFEVNKLLLFRKAFSSHCKSAFYTFFTLSSYVLLLPK